MHWIDILVIATLLISGAFAYARGFVHEVLSIAGWVGATFATLYGTPILKFFTYNFIASPFVAEIVTGIVVFIGSLVILSIVTKNISRGVKESALGALDRALGFLFGLLRGALVACLVWIGYEWFTPPKEQPESIHLARSTPLLIQGADFLRSLAPAQPPAAPKDPNQDPRAPQQPGGGQNGSQNGGQNGGQSSILQKAITPTIQAPGNPNDEGYGRKERNEMDRLIQTNQ